MKELLAENVEKRYRAENLGSGTFSISKSKKPCFVFREA